MGELNIPDRERSALLSVDEGELDRLVQQSIRDGRSLLYQLPLGGCGPYVAGKLRDFEQALADHGKARVPRKVEETMRDLNRAGHHLRDAVRDMKRRVDEVEADDQLFYVFDDVHRPGRLGMHLEVRVAYRWRRAVGDQWNSGSILFLHDVDVRPDYSVPLPTRKPSAAKLERDRQEMLHGVWEHLVRLALYSVREYLKAGVDLDRIPSTFKVKTDGYTRGLNNFSAQFWKGQP